MLPAKTNRMTAGQGEAHVVVGTTPLEEAGDAHKRHDG